jgi:hypothetical protein
VAEVAAFLVLRAFFLVARLRPGAFFGVSVFSATDF